MLPLSGYFKAIPCPFFNSGLCERPHCHFKHVKRDVVTRKELHSYSTEETASANVSLLYEAKEKEDALHKVNEAIRQVLEEMERDKAQMQASAIGMGCTESKQYANNISYIPTPVTKCSAKSHYTEKKTVLKSHLPVYDMPVYKPTPLDRLTKNKKRKKIEYDPCIASINCEKREKNIKHSTAKYSLLDLSQGSSSSEEGYVPKRIKLSNIEKPEDTEAGRTYERQSPKFSDEDEGNNVMHVFPSEWSETRGVEVEKNKNISECEKESDYDFVNKILKESKEHDISREMPINIDSKHGTSQNGKKLKDETKVKANARKLKIDPKSSNIIKSSKKELTGKNHAEKSIKPDSSSKVKTDSDKVSKLSEDTSVKFPLNVKKTKQKLNTQEVHKKLKDCKDKNMIKESKTKDEHLSICEKDKRCSKTASTKKCVKSKTQISKEANISTQQKKKCLDLLEKEQDSAVSSSCRPHSPVVISKSTSNDYNSSDSQSVSSTSKNQVQPIIQAQPSVGNAENSSLSEEELFDSSALDTDLDEHDTYEECWRIFNEDQTLTSQDQNPSMNKVRRMREAVKTEADVVVLGKKRVAHQPSLSRPQAQIKAVRKLSAAEVMLNRHLLVQQQYNKTSSNKVHSAFLNCVSQSFDGSKKRIAHVPNALKLAEAATVKKATLNHLLTVSPKKTSATCATSAPKGGRRVAHVPSLTILKRPVIPCEYGSKVPTNIRQRYLNVFIDECLKMYVHEEQAFKRALEEEKNTYNRSSNKTLYLNLAVNTLKRLRDEAETTLHESPGADSTVDDDIATTSKTNSSSLLRTQKTHNKVISHEYVLGGSKAAKTSFSIERRKSKPEKEEVKGLQLYKLLLPYTLTPKQLEEHGFPKLHPSEPGRAIIHTKENKKQTSDSFERTCSRCQTVYRVNTRKHYVNEEECVYHWGRVWKKRIAGNLESRYSCCQGDTQSEGCCVAAGHVHEGCEEDILKGFVKTLPKTPPINGDYKVYSLDCEMCYTTAGMELTRITVIGPTLQPVYEALVKPENPILDYNTRFSGITEKDMEGVTTRLRDIQAVLLSLFSDKTILIGHSLESDLKALKIAHNTVVDTSVVFPHKRGLPFKRALRTLMAENLNKIIQNDVEGHDSQEDAVACYELMLWKVKEDLRKMNR
ncbi:RNA exonuclease 1 homolog [Tachypleus tridentatus]|uniref:RNA exonuclease 1 homolog n=1 Tax=Tachypleus tridentatus TaxID=6853 RepID=UPI003FD146B3